MVERLRFRFDLIDNIVYRIEQLLARRKYRDNPKPVVTDMQRSGWVK